MITLVVGIILLLSVYPEKTFWVILITIEKIRR